MEKSMEVMNSAKTNSRTGKRVKDLSLLGLTLSISLGLLVAPVHTARAAEAEKTKAAPAKTTKPEAEKADKTDKTDKTPKKADDKTAAKPAEKKDAKPAPEPVIENVVNVQAEQLVDNPNEYLGKNIRFVSNFYAFSNLALDYKPALRAAKDHLSFLVLKANSHIPLSELKLAMVTPKDEKDPMSKVLLALKDKDQIEVTGKVFAVALDEPWVDVLRLKVVKAAPVEGEDKDKKAAEPAK